MIQTMHKDRGMTLRPPAQPKRYSLLDVSRAISITAYIESMLDDIDRILNMKIDQRVKNSVRKLLSSHDQKAVDFLSDEMSFQMTCNISREIDKYRENCYKSISKKGLDDKHFILFITYELSIMHDTLKKLNYQTVFRHVNSLNGLINACNDWLNKNGFVDSLNIHKKRGEIQNTLNECINDVHLLYKEVEAQQ